MKEGYRSILLAYDGSRRGHLALEGAMPLLKSSNCAVHLLAVMPVSGTVTSAEGFFSEAFYKDERERVQGVLDDGIKRLKEQGITAEAHLRCGQPARQICELAQDLNTDLVVVGHQHRGPLARWWQGSVGASLIDLLDCSLLIVQGENGNDGW